MSLQLKSYFAGSVEAALLMARRELGDEAMLIESKRATGPGRAQGEYEVVFALETAANSGFGPAAADPQSPRADSLAEEVAGLRGELERLSRMWSRADAFLFPEVLDQPALCAVLAGLLRQELAPVLVREIAAALRARLGEAAGLGAGRVQRETGAWMRERIETAAPNFQAAPATEGNRCVLAFVGPPGAGKTSSLVKISALAAVKARRSTLILSADSERIAAPEQLRCYAGLLGVAFEAVESGEQLRMALDMHRSRSVILIDTPGYPPRDMQHAAPLAEALRGQPGIETHLVLPANLRAPDLSAAIDRYRLFQPARLLFTRLDETSTYGPIWNESARTGLPLSYFSSGTQIPEDIAPATAERLADLLLEDLRRIAAHPAARGAAA